MPVFAEQNVPLDQLLLDPNNYRFQDLADFVVAAEERFAEESVQDRAYRRLRDDPTLVRLKNSWRLIDATGVVGMDGQMIAAFLADRLGAALPPTDHASLVEAFLGPFRP